VTKRDYLAFRDADIGKVGRAENRVSQPQASPQQNHPRNHADARNGIQAAMKELSHRRGILTFFCDGFKCLVGICAGYPVAVRNPAETAWKSPIRLNRRDRGTFGAAAKAV